MDGPILSNSPPTFSNHTADKDQGSMHTLRTIDDRAQLLKDSTTPVSNYGAVAPSTSKPEYDTRATKRKLFIAALLMAILFIVSTAVLAGTLYVALPTLDDADRPLLRIPRSFEQLQELNQLIKKYRSLYPFRILLCFVITYLFLQAFSLPGSMYMSILAGAVWGPARAIPLCCTCVASGATLCYFIGAALGPALLLLPTWKSRLDRWATKIDSQRANLISFLIVLRIAPFPPHWVVNVLCPHLGIGLVPFFVSTWLGILGVTVIHTSIGGGLEQMTSADDFHLISWRNFLGLSAVVVAVLIPVGIRWFYRGELESVAQVQEQEIVDELDEEASIQGTPDLSKGKGVVFVYDVDDLTLPPPENGAPLGDSKGKAVLREWLYEEDDEMYNDDEEPPERRTEAAETQDHR